MHRVQRRILLPDPGCTPGGQVMLTAGSARSRACRKSLGPACWLESWCVEAHSQQLAALVQWSMRVELGDSTVPPVQMSVRDDLARKHRHLFLHLDINVPRVLDGSYVAGMDLIARVGVADTRLVGRASHAPAALPLAVLLITY